MNEAANASRVELSAIVDEVRYGQDASYFHVEEGKRIITIGSNAFDKTYAGQLIEGSHQIAHAQFFDRLVKQKGFSAAEAEYSGLEKSWGTAGYTYEEVAVQRLPRWGVRNYLGGLTPQQEAASTKYIQGWFNF